MSTKTIATGTEPGSLLRRAVTVAATAVVAALALTGVPAAAHDWDHGRGHERHHHRGWYAPPPVVVVRPGPRVVYAPPPPVVYAPPPPVVYAPPPPVVYAPPATAGLGVYFNIR